MIFETTVRKVTFNKKKTEYEYGTVNVQSFLLNHLIGERVQVTVTPINSKPKIEMKKNVRTKNPHRR